jgi:penicillin-binding protein 2
LSSVTGTPPRRLRRTEFLPPDKRVEVPYRFTPRLALRLAILGALAIVVFAVLFFRLWALQVLSGTDYLRAAQNNQLRIVRIEAPRGPILDHDGRELVTNVPGTVVRLWPQDLPKTWAGRRAEIRRLASILDLRPPEIVSALKRHAGDPLTPVTIKEGVHEPQAAYLAEHQDEFRGVDVHSTYLRHYPFQALAAHILGHVGEISPAQLKEPQFRKSDANYQAGDRVGQGGVEAEYDQYLRGTPGSAELRVDALGRPRGEFKPRKQPIAGDALRLTIDVRTQQAAERAIRYGIALAHQDGQWAANGGAIVALDPRTGAVRALASYPTFMPNLFVGRVNPKKLDAAGLGVKTAKEKNYPAVDRAIAGTYPAGSTFKPITALAAMQEHLVSPYDPLDCTGVYTVRGPDGQIVPGGIFKNWDPGVNTPMTLPVALEASCDTYFYQLGYDFYKLPADRGHPLQAWARRFGIGRRSGVDLPGESAGLLPTPEWRKRAFTKKTDPTSWQLDRIWKPGDSIQLAIGQKDLALTPLQLARVYAMIANGGKLVTPYLAQDAEQLTSSGGSVRHPLKHKPPEPIGVDPYALSVVRDGLYLATHGAIGTATAVFGGFPIPIAGKTGTAEKAVTLPGSRYATLVSQSWWCGYGPTDKPELVVCALIENGGHGGTAAAPAALQVFKQYFHRTASFSLPGSSD